MTTTRGILALSALLLGLAASTGAHAQAMPRETFLVMDIDGNGQVEAIEFGVAMGAAFAHSDDNADGVLSVEEAAVLSLPAEVDADGDGRITVIEFLTSVRTDFQTADQDGDGILLP